MLLFLFALVLQRDAGWLQGRVTDKETAAGVPNVQVILSDADGRNVLQSQTNQSGAFVLIGIPSGQYELTLRSPLYPEYRLRSVEVRADCANVVAVQIEQKVGLQTVMASSERRAPQFDGCQIERFDRARMENLPGARNIWYWLETQDPSSVTDLIDEGGIQTGRIGLAGTYGGSWTQNGYRWDGLNITNPYEPGKPLTYALPGILQEFRVAATPHSAEIAAAGAEFQVTSRRGGRKRHGEASVYYTGDPFQSSNLDDQLRVFGFQTTPHIRRFPEAELSLGGPFPRREHWTYFASFGVQHVSRVIPDFAALPKTNVQSAALRADGALGSQDDIAMLASGQIVKNSHLGARSGIEPSSALLGNDRFELLHGHWTHRRSDQAIAGLSFGFSHSSPTDTLQRGTTRPSTTRLFTGEAAGSAPLESDAALSRFSLSGWMRGFPERRNNWQHHFNLGFDLEESLATVEQRVFQSVQLFLFPGNSASEVAEFNTPSHAMQRLREFSVLGGDDVEIGGRIFLRVGFNLDLSNASLPRQVSGAGTFAAVREFAGAGNVVSWKSISPRAGVTVPLLKRFGDTRFIAGYARYDHVLPSSYADFANPTALGGRLYRWIDRNGDRLFQPGEEGTLLRVFGGPFSSVDPNLRRPFTDEWQVGLDRDFGHGIEGRLRLFERDSKKLVHTTNVGVPVSAYTAVNVLDPGDDGVAGTHDDRVLTVFDQDPQTLGQDRYILTNPPGLRSTSKGLETRLTGKLVGDGFFSLSFTAYRSIGDGNPGNSVLENDPNLMTGLFDNPNSLINSRGRLFFDRAYVAKVAAYQPIPLGLRLSSVVSYFDGLPFGRKLIVPDLNQGPFFVMATPRGEPGGVRTQFNMTFDQRVAREFKLGNVRMSAMMDTFNLLNLNKSLREFDVTGPAFAQRKPVEVENPRAFRFGVRALF